MARKRKFYNCMGEAVLMDVYAITEEEEMSLMKKCNRCNEIKFMAEFFNKDVKRKLKSPYCKRCFQERNNEYKRKNKEKVKLIKRKEYLKNKRTYDNTNYLRKYGISHDVYDSMVSRQQGKCYICKQAPKHRLFIDHCHQSGKVRDLLCGNCNRMVGEAKENIQTLLNAIEYLKRHVNEPITVEI